MELGIENIGVAAVVVLMILDKLKGIVPKIIIRNNGRNGNEVDIPKLPGRRFSDPNRIVVEEELQKQLKRMFDHVERQDIEYAKLVTRIDSTLVEQTDVLRKLVVTQAKLLRHLENGHRG